MITHYQHFPHFTHTRDRERALAQSLAPPILPLAKADMPRFTGGGFNLKQSQKAIAWQYYSTHHHTVYTTTMHFITLWYYVRRGMETFSFVNHISLNKGRPHSQASPVFCLLVCVYALPLPCIILNTNWRTKNREDWELARLPTCRCYVKSPTAQDVFWPIPGLISCTGITRGLPYMNLMHKTQSGAWSYPSRPNLSCWLFIHVVGRNTYWCVKMTWRQLLLMLLYNRRLRCYTLQTVILESHSTEQKHSVVPVQQIVAP